MDLAADDNVADMDANPDENISVPHRTFTTTTVATPSAPSAASAPVSGTSGVWGATLKDKLRQKAHVRKSEDSVRRSRRLVDNAPKSERQLAKRGVSLEQRDSAPKSGDAKDPGDAAATTTLMWVEKYRPKTLDDIVGNREVLDTLRSYLLTTHTPSAGGPSLSAACRIFPPLILTGPSGIGKTTCMHALARQLLGTEWYKLQETVIEINGSDDRTAPAIMSKLGPFCTRKTSLPRGLPCVVIIDEAESMDKMANSAVAALIENTKTPVLWMIACNDSTKIHADIQDRAVMQRFEKLSVIEIVHVLRRIALAEDVLAEPDAYEVLAESAMGDLRVAIHAFQMLALTCCPPPILSPSRSDALLQHRRPINTTDVHKLALKPQTITLDRILQCCICNQLPRALLYAMTLTRVITRVSALRGTALDTKIQDCSAALLSSPALSSSLQAAASHLRSLPNYGSPPATAKKDGDDTKRASFVPQPAPAFRSTACFSHLEVINSLFQQLMVTVMNESLRLIYVRTVAAFQMRQSEIGEARMQLPALLATLCRVAKEFKHQQQQSKTRTSTKTTRPSSVTTTAHTRAAPPAKRQGSAGAAAAAPPAAAGGASQRPIAKRIKSEGA